MEMHTIQSLQEIHGIDLQDRTCESRSLASLKDLLFHFFRGIADEYEYRTAEAALMRLTDHQLRDIGIARGDIRTKVRNGRGRL